MRFITVRQYINGEYDKNEPVFIETAWGMQQVTGIRWPETDPWVVCGKANGGFGCSYCVSWGDRLWMK